MSKIYRLKAGDLVVQRPYKIGVIPNWVMFYKINDGSIILDSHVITEPMLTPVTIEIDDVQLQDLLFKIRTIHNNHNLDYKLGTQVKLVDNFL